MGEEGVDIRMISHYLGHKKLESTLVYTHLTPLLKQGVAEKINQVMAGVPQRDGYAAMKAPAMEVADVMRAFGGQYMTAYAEHMPAIHRKAMADMTACRTSLMGGTTFWCPSCHHYQYSYHSCGNRNCNKCGNERAQHWLEKTGKLLLPVEHFMVTVTLPGELRRMARSHQKLFYGLLMASAAASLPRRDAHSTNPGLGLPVCGRTNGPE